MKKYRFLFVAIIFFAALVLATPALIGALPDRYVFRLPEPLQKFGLPQTQAALLPTANTPLTESYSSSPQSAREVNSTTPISSTTPVSDKGTGEISKTSLATPANTQPMSMEEMQPPTPTATATLTPTPKPTETPTPWPLPPQTRMQGFQHIFQTWNNCGPATLAMGLSYFGEELSQEQTAAVLKPNPEDRNVSPHEMAAYVNEETPHSALYRANGNIEILKRLIANNIPVIIETGINPPGEFRWLGWYGHYYLLVAYSDDEEQFWVYDSWLGTSEEPLQNAHPDGRIIDYQDLIADWSNFNYNYIVIYQPDQQPLINEIIGQDMEDSVMWLSALERSKSDTDREPGNPFYWFNLGTNYAALGQYQEAAAAFDQARAIGLPWRMLWYQFGPFEAYLNTDRYQDVVLLADTTLEGRPYFEESYYYKGLALQQLGETEAARENLERAASFNPNFVPAQTALAELK